MNYVNFVTDKVIWHIRVGWEGIAWTGAVVLGFLGIGPGLGGAGLVAVNPLRGAGLVVDLSLGLELNTRPTVLSASILPTEIEQTSE